MTTMRIWGLAFFLTCSVFLKAEVFYVRTDGNDRNKGGENTAAAAWRTMYHSIAHLQPGDTLLVGDGVYQEPGLIINNVVGTKDKWTVIKSINPWGAKIEGMTIDNVVGIRNSAYVVIDGFEVYPQLKQYHVESGVMVSDLKGDSHHIVIRNCYVHDCGCGGISSKSGDYLTIESNVVRDNAKNNQWNCSGISMWHPNAIDDKDRFHLVVRGNVSFKNECDIPFAPLGHDKPTDGNGIIIDDLKHSQDDAPEYTQKVLVENNLVFDNGGRGVNVFMSNNVTVRNNTSWHNNKILSKYHENVGEIMFSGSSEGACFNNIAVKTEDQPGHAFVIEYSGDITHVPVENNIFIGSVYYPDGAPTQKNNTLEKEARQSCPDFVNAMADLKFESFADFSQYFDVNKGSPALKAGNTKQAPKYNIDGLPWSNAGKANIGCY